MEAGFAIQHKMHTLVSAGRKPPLGGVTARPSQHHFAGRITAPDLLVERTVEPAIVAAFQGVHDHEGDTASVFPFIPWLATFLLAPTGALGLASVPHTTTGVRVGVTFAPTLLAFVRGRRWRRFPIDFDEEDVALVCWGLRVLHIHPTIFAHADGEMLDGFTGRGPAIKTSKEQHRCRKAHPCSQAGDSTQHEGAEAIPCQSDMGIDRVEAASTFASHIGTDLRNPDLALTISPLEILEISGKIHPTPQTPSMNERKVGWLPNNLSRWPTSSNLSSMKMSSMSVANKSDLPSANVSSRRFAWASRWWPPWPPNRSKLLPICIASSMSCGNLSRIIKPSISNCSNPLLPSSSAPPCATS